MLVASHDARRHSWCLNDSKWASTGHLETCPQREDNAAHLSSCGLVLDGPRSAGVKTQMYTGEQTDGHQSEEQRVQSEKAEARKRATLRFWMVLWLSSRVERALCVERLISGARCATGY